MSSSAPVDQVDQKEQLTWIEEKLEFKRGLWSQSIWDAIGMAGLLLSVGFVVTIFELAKYLKLLAWIGDWSGLIFEVATLSIWITLGYAVLRKVIAHYVDPAELPEVKKGTFALYFVATATILLISSIPSFLLYSFMFKGVTHGVQILAMSGVAGGGLLFGLLLLSGIVFLFSFSVCAGFAATLLPQLVLERRVSMCDFKQRAYHSFGYVMGSVLVCGAVCAILKLGANILTIWFMSWTPEYRPLGLDFAWQGFLGGYLNLFFTALMIVLVMNTMVRAYILGEAYLRGPSDQKDVEAGFAESAD